MDSPGFFANEKSADNVSTMNKTYDAIVLGAGAGGGV